MTRKGEAWDGQGVAVGRVGSKSSWRKRGSSVRLRRRGVGEVLGRASQVLL